MKTCDDVMRAMLAIFPDAELSQDNDGQLVIYTGLKLSPGDSVAPFEDKPCDDCGATDASIDCICPQE